MKTLKRLTLIYSGGIMSLLVFSANQTFGQDPLPADTSGSFLIINESSQKRKHFRMTTLTFGGNGANFTKVNNQFTVMTGGRGSATFNKRYTIGGGGWGMTKGVEVESSTEGTFNFVKIGYGGIDFGYLIATGEKINLGTKLLIAGGAVIKETVPESDDNDFRMFPVLEPTVYYQIAFSKLFRFEMGASYRFIRGTNLPYISDREMSGFSRYIGFLVRACNCN